MIFDSVHAEELYREFLKSENAQLIDEIHKLADPFIRAIARQINPYVCDDLTQEGHIKMNMLLMKGRYDPDRGSLYSFLRTVLGNCMIDYLRRESDVLPIPDNVRSSAVQTVEFTIDYSQLAAYTIKRFPSLHYTIAADASRYVVQSICENVAGKSKGVLRTLELIYPMDRNTAYIFYHSVSVLLRLMCDEDSSDVDYESALAIAQLYELTMLPELVLILGDISAAHVLRLFKGIRIKF